MGGHKAQLAMMIFLSIYLFFPLVNMIPCQYGRPVIGVLLFYLHGVIFDVVKECTQDPISQIRYLPIDRSPA